MNKWNKILYIDELRWRKVFRMPFVVTNNTKLQWLQYRINHRILATNNFLFKIKITDSPLCVFCKTENESIEHILWDCEVTQNCLHDIEYWFLSIGISLPMTKSNFIFGDVSKLRKGDPYNLIFLYIKQYIYNCKCFGNVPSLPPMKEKLKYMYHLEKIIAVKNKRLTEFDKEWNIYKDLLS